MTQKAMNIPSDVPTRKLRFISHSAPISPMPRIAPKRRPLILAKCSRFDGFMCGVHFSAFDMASVPFLSFFLSFFLAESVGSALWHQIFNRFLLSASSLLDNSQPFRHVPSFKGSQHAHTVGGRGRIFLIAEHV